MVNVSNRLLCYCWNLPSRFFRISNLGAGLVVRQELESLANYRCNYFAILSLSKKEPSAPPRVGVGLEGLRVSQREMILLLASL